ncbi:putative peptidase M23B (plasmid) [Leptolyngbya sp. NIES-3755]|nr:putative peptidase M23B [Leptolyngbya sp. NIES-3755]
MNQVTLLWLSVRSNYPAVLGWGILLLSSASLLNPERASAQSAIDSIGATTPDVTIVDSAPQKSPSSAEVSPSTESYIDRTEYNLGATQREVAPVPTVARRAPVENPANSSDRTPLPEDTSASSTSNHPDSAPQQSLATVQPNNPTQLALNHYNRVILPKIQSGDRASTLVFPLSIPAPITSLFGWRMHPIMKTLRFHSGTDIGAELGTPVVAAMTGQVTIADFVGGYGFSVGLQHQNATQETFYAHLSEIFVKPGQTVKQGEVIGRVGQTGTATGPNLHFEMRQMTATGWENVDPGVQLETAMAQLVKTLQTAQSSTRPQS